MAIFKFVDKKKNEIFSIGKNNRIRLSSLFQLEDITNGNILVSSDETLCACSYNVYITIRITGTYLYVRLLYFLTIAVNPRSDKDFNARRF